MGLVRDGFVEVEKTTSGWRVENIHGLLASRRHMPDEHSDHDPEVSSPADPQVPGESQQLPVFVRAPVDEPVPDPTAPPPQPAPVDDEPLLPAIAKRVRALLERHANKLWWLHSLYALSLGAFVVTFADKGFEHARFLTISLAAGWLVLIVFFRVFGGDARHAHDKAEPEEEPTDEKAKRVKKIRKVGFYVMTYLLKNLYQGMLFFLLPFYWKSATGDGPTRWFVIGLGILAILSTLDVVFDNFLMRWKVGASLVYLFILFACLNLVIPALFPDTRTLLSLMLAAAISAAWFWSMHVPLRALGRPGPFIAFMLSITAATSAAYFGRRAIPPVPLHIASAAVGPSLLPDGRLTMHVTRLHSSYIQEMHALTDVVIPGGEGGKLFHVWRHGELEMQRGPVEPSGDPPKGTVRLRSTLRSFNLPSDLSGHWSVDVVTTDDQLIGRVRFEVID